MRMSTSNVSLASVIVLASLFAGPAGAKQATDRGSIDKIVAGWAEGPRLGANQMLAKYGLPQEATSEQLIWHKPGPFKRITVFNLETPHDFPLPHIDYMEHTITYDVPQDKVGDLIAFDASSTINRTVGEVSARCDLEGHNILTLNLNHDIVTGKKSVEAARQAFGEIVGQDVKGERPAYVEALQFKPHDASVAAFSDEPVIPGSPVRAADDDEYAKSRMATNGSRTADAEALAMITAIDLNQVVAAAEAQKKKVSRPVMDYARMLHQAHGANMVKGLELGVKIGVTPVDTVAVGKLKSKGTGELAALVALDGEAFERSYLAAMVKGHTEVMGMIDGQLLKAASNDALKQHLTETRKHVAAHLAKSTQLQAALGQR